MPPDLARDSGNAVASTSGMPAPDPEPLYGAHHFRVLIGRQEVGFAEVTGLTSETHPDVTTAAPPHRFEPVVLRRALTTSRELYDWRRRIVEGRDDRRRVTIQLLAGAGGPVAAAWQLEGAWPRRWSGPAFNAQGNEIAMEEIELAYDDLVWLEEQPSRHRGKPNKGA
jgi:phage tail-like protein